jgi:hypothetical protein
MMNRTARSARTSVGRCRTTLALAITGLALAGLATCAIPASASTAAPRAGIGTFFFSTGVASVSGGGHVWSLNLGLVGIGPSFDTVTLGISTPHLGGVEHHTWAGQLASGDVSLSSTAVMTIKSRSSLSPIASLSLAFKPSSRKTEKADCVTGREIVYTGTFKGSARLSTGLKGLNLGAAHLSFGSHNTLTALGSCVFSPCHFTSWNSATVPSATAPFAGAIDIVVPGHFSNTTVIERSASIPGKNGLVRDDVWSIRTKAPVFNKSTKSLSVTSSSSGLVTGTATFSHGKPSGSPFHTPKTCLFQGRKYAQRDTQYLNATFSASRQFEAHSILNGVVRVQRSSTGRFDIVTLRASH